MTDQTPYEIAHKCNAIIEGHKGEEAIVKLLSEYPYVPEYIEPYLKSIYYKSMNELGKAAVFMDDAIRHLLKDDVSSQSGEVFGLASFKFFLDLSRKNCGDKLERYIPMLDDLMMHWMRIRSINLSIFVSKRMIFPEDYYLFGL